MNGGVTVVLCIVGALVLCEAVLPRALAALLSRRQNQAQTATNRTVAASATGVVTGAPLANAGRGGRDGTEVPRLRSAARTMTHRFRPDWEKDRERLSKIYEAARLGRLEALVELGTYAYSRGAIVEAFYWTYLAMLKGMDGLDEMLFEMRTRWLAEGCPAEFENAYADFTEEQGEFARAVLCLQCDVDPQYASIRLDELSDAGNEDAQLFLSREAEETEA